jgi:hypothetical protein
MGPPDLENERHTARWQTLLMMAARHFPDNAAKIKARLHQSQASEVDGTRCGAVPFVAVFAPASAQHPSFVAIVRGTIALLVSQGCVWVCAVAFVMNRQPTQEPAGPVSDPCPHAQVPGGAAVVSVATRGGGHRDRPAPLLTPSPGVHTSRRGRCSRGRCGASPVIVIVGVGWRFPVGPSRILLTWHITEHGKLGRGVGVSAWL